LHFSGQDTLAMPTVVVNQFVFLPALLGITIVISPLIALMKDQVDGLKANGIEACFINSSQTEDERQFYIKLKIKLLSWFTLLRKACLLDIFNSLNISLIAIDEAHCISSGT
jgi:ATP-dependent DNA helicase RecQ